MIFWSMLLGFLTGGALFAFLFRYRYRKMAVRIERLTDYLEKINTGGQGLLFDFSEDEFSRLQDEIYKTVTTLYQTRDDALAARKCFAENLANIAHQLKTPITSISLSVQMAKEKPEEFCAAGIERQIGRLTHLEEALLLLSRIDAGTLAIDRKMTDVFTLLTLAADHLYELSVQEGVVIDVPEMGETAVCVDPEWTMEAVMNLMKNCMEHSRGKTVHCSYAQNPLYTEILIWDEGEGFAKEDIPHLFERFYRGQNAGEGGIGIGLALAKEIIERQNGTIRARNKRDGGACFEVRFYSH